MIYHYIVRVEYKKNNSSIIKDYTRDFCSIVIRDKAEERRNDKDD